MDPAQQNGQRVKLKMVKVVYQIVKYSLSVLLAILFFAILSQNAERYPLDIRRICFIEHLVDVLSSIKKYNIRCRIRLNKQLWLPDYGYIKSAI